MPRVGESTAVWQAQRVYVLDPSNKLVPVDARVNGPFAVHVGLGSDSGQWVLTHTKTGLLVLVVASNTEAMAAGDALWSSDLLRPLFHKTDKSIIRAEAPSWIKPWIEACHKQGKCLPFPKLGS